LPLFYLLQCMIKYLWPAIAWSLTVVALTLIPGEQIPNVPVFGIDKLVHIFIFGLMMTLTAVGLYKSSFYTSIKRPTLIAVVYSIGFGMIIEFIQPYIPGRSFSLFDILANVMGVALGYGLYVFLRRKYI
jgi:VanZ family protein